MLTVYEEFDDGKKRELCQAVDAKMWYKEPGLSGIDSITLHRVAYPSGSPLDPMTKRPDFPRKPPSLWTPENTSDETISRLTTIVGALVYMMGGSVSLSYQELLDAEKRKAAQAYQYQGEERMVIEVEDQ